ncbi:MAG: 30S ribosomal protein S17e [Candidatus Thermoplasmatota archaeon]|nr:30S ribosomal protein S17e [Candidatus Thermoplasmatota archaeon]MCL5963328.1 30S ribosomal protein S17e [Candidatus Thermoplasmatota archaeon]
MGKIRHKFIKRIAIELVNNYPEEFTDDFYYNREKVIELTDLASVTSTGVVLKYKKTINRIAGYTTRYYKWHKRSAM